MPLILRKLFRRRIVLGAAIALLGGVLVSLVADHLEDIALPNVDRIVERVSRVMNGG